MKDLRLDLLAVLVASLGLVACGGDDDNMNMPDALRRDSGPDAPRPPDSGMGPDAMATCGLAMNVGDISGSFMQTEVGVVPISSNPMSTLMNYTYFFAVLNNDLNPDIFNAELYDGFGAFAGTTVQASMFPHTYTIPTDDPTAMGAPYDYQTCGICATIFTDLDMMNGYEPTQGYVMTSGTINVMSVEPFAATITNGMLEEIVLGTDPMTYGTIKAGGCKSQIMTATFSQAVDCGLAGKACCGTMMPRCSKPLTCNTTTMMCQ